VQADTRIIVGNKYDVGFTTKESINMDRGEKSTKGYKTSIELKNKHYHEQVLCLVDKYMFENVRL